MCTKLEKKSPSRYDKTDKIYLIILCNDYAVVSYAERDDRGIKPQAKMRLLKILRHFLFNFHPHPLIIA